MVPKFIEFFLVPLVPVIAIFLGLFFGLFFYWRAAKRELVGNQLIFDTVAVFLFGAAIGGRVIDFLVRYDFYSWSLKKFLFFNAYWGFDIRGAFLGGLILVWFYLRTKKDNFWDIFDYAAQGFAFGAFLFYVMSFVGVFLKSELVLGSAIYTLGYFLIFWAIKRMEKQKKHRGFFACFFLVTLSLLAAAELIIHDEFVLINNWWPLTFTVFLFLSSSVFWYFIAKRALLQDVKSAFGFLLLFFFKTFRTLTNIKEADSVARTIILSPLSVAKGLYNLVKYLGREIYLTFSDVKQAFGARK